MTASASRFRLGLALPALGCALACGSADRITGERSGPEATTAVPPPPIPPPKTAGFIWGVQGHPGQQAAYQATGSQLTTQLNYLNTLRARYYRVDLSPDLAGNVSPSFSGILDAADAKGIKILPILVRVPDPTQSLGNLYNQGYSIGYNFASRYKGRFTYVEAGNELDNFAILGSDKSGTSYGDYSATRLRAATAFLRGMTIGIHSGAPGTGVVIDAGFTHFAFVDALSRDSVPFDTYGWHWYSDMDNGSTFGAVVPSHLPDPNKEIWITEVNRRNDAVSYNNPSDQAAVIAKYVRHFYGIPRVKAFFVYELFEEKAFGATNPESYYGIVGCTDGSCTSTAIKPAFDAYRYGIEERLFGYEDYVYSLYVHLNRNTPDAAGLAFWTNRFKATPDTLALINSFAPEASYKVFIGDQYIALLDRALTQTTTDQAGLTYWNDQMRSGLSRRSLIIQFCSTPEFWSKSGSNSGGFVDRLYLKLFRVSPPDAAGRTYWISRLALGTPKWDVADAFLGDQRYQTNFVKDQFQAVLDRPPTTSEVSFYVNKMQQGSTEEAVIRLLLRLPEFGSKAVKSGYGRRS